jgi:thiol-disulfide isomerase/thioredoxin
MYGAVCNNRLPLKFSQLLLFFGETFDDGMPYLSSSQRGVSRMNWPKYVIIYGPTVAWIALVLALGDIYLACRGSRYFIPRSWKRWLAVSVACVVIYYSVNFLNWSRLKVNPLQPVYAHANQKAPPFDFHLVSDGSQHSLDDYRGKVIVLNIWATWCDPCVEEMPELDKFQREYRDRGVAVITVSDQSPQDILKFPGFQALQTVKAYVEGTETSAPLFVRGEVARPITHLIDADGVLRETYIGPHNAAFFEEQVKPYLRPVPST